MDMNGDWFFSLSVFLTLSLFCLSLSFLSDTLPCFSSSLSSCLSHSVSFPVCVYVTLSLSLTLCLYNLLFLSLFLCFSMSVCLPPFLSPFYSFSLLFSMSFTFRSQCKHGYQGVNCEYDVNECQSNPCRNGGTCINMVNHFYCSCPPGTKGTRHTILQCHNHVENVYTFENSIGMMAVIALTLV